MTSLYKPLIVEAEAIINSRPLTMDPTAPLEPLTPNQILTLRVVLFFLHLATSLVQTYTAEEDGAESSIWPMTSGTDGRRKSFSPYRFAINGQPPDVT